MDDVPVVRGGQAAGDLDAVLHSLPDRRRPVRKPLAERSAFEQFGDNVGHAIVGTDVVDGQDIRMIQRRGRARFLLEAAQPIGIGRQGCRQHLDRDVTSRRGSRAR